MDILSDIAKSKNEISIIEEFEWNGSEWPANMIFHKKTKETLISRMMIVGKDGTEFKAHGRILSEEVFSSKRC